jgi:hypothetical protein
MDVSSVCSLKAHSLGNTRRSTRRDAVDRRLIDYFFKLTGPRSQFSPAAVK